MLKKVFRYKPNPNIHLYGEQQLTTVINHNAYIRTITRSVDEQLDKLDKKAELPEEDKSTNSESVTASDEDKEYDEENDNDKAE